MIRFYFSGIRRELEQKEIGLWAQAIAFKVLVTTVPLAVLATGIAGQVLSGPDASAAVAQFFQRILPGQQARSALAFLDAVSASSPAIVSIGGAGLLLSVVFLFSTLRTTVQHALRQSWHESRSALRGYLFDLRMTLQVGLLFLLSVGVSVGVQSVAEGSVAGHLLGTVLSLAVTIAMFFQLYHFVPLPRPSLQSSLVGATWAGILWEIAKYGLTLLVATSNPLDVSTPEEGVTALGALFGFVVAFVTWVYYSGLVLLLGAVVASLRERAVEEEAAPPP